MTGAVIVLILVTLQRLGELLLASRNTRRLLARGGHEVGRSHYPVMVLLHASWLLGLWVLAWDRPIAWPWLAIFLVLQVGRLWVIATLGGRWTTRVIVLPGAPLVRHGPFRFASHPNYIVVAGEIAALPLAFGLVSFAVAFSLLNAAMLAYRIRCEAAALRQNADPAATHPAANSA